MQERSRFEDLVVWQKAIDLTAMIYRISTSFPKEEIYGLTNQARRSAVSIASNIAEGSTRGSKKEFIYFLNVAYGSLAELKTQLFIAQKIGYISEETIHPITLLLDELSRLLKGLKRSLAEK